MLDKGYPFPLYSFDLLLPGGEPEDDPRYAIAIPGGRLVVRAALRKRAMNISTASCQEAVAVALGHHQVALAAFAEHGFSAAWADSLRHWEGRLREHEGQRSRLSHLLDELTRERRALLAAARELWGRLRVATELAGIGGAVVRGSPPGRELELCDALSGALGRLAAPSVPALLARNGFPQALIDQLTSVAARLPASRRQADGLAQARQRESDALVAIRAALLGDVARLCKVAPYVLLPEARRPLNVERLFGLRG
jgi:hypothetical protein